MNKENCALKLVDEIILRMNSICEVARGPRSAHNPKGKYLDESV